MFVTKSDMITKLLNFLELEIVDITAMLSRIALVTKMKLQLEILQKLNVKSYSEHCQTSKMEFQRFPVLVPQLAMCRGSSLQ